MNKQDIKNLVKQFNNDNNSKLKVVYIHLNGFSHAIGFGTPNNYNTIAFSHYTKMNDNSSLEEKLANIILSKFAHIFYKHNPKEIIFQKRR